MPDRSGEVLPTITRVNKIKIPEYQAWLHIKRRCYNPNTPQFQDYGGRGISMDPIWRKSFAAFLHDVGHRPSRLHSIDRFPNNNGNYEPGNVRWATQSEQCRNKRNNCVLEFAGKKQTMIEWAEEKHISLQTLSARIHTMKWSVEKSLTTPVRGVGWRTWKSIAQHFAKSSPQPFSLRGR